MVFQEPSVGVGGWDKAVSWGKRAPKERPMLSAGGGIRGVGSCSRGSSAELGLRLGTGFGEIRDL